MASGQNPYSPKSLKFGVTLKKKIHKQSTRSKLAEKFGNKAFLMPQEKKFPIINPNTGKVSCKLLKAAKIRASQHGYSDVISKADKLLQEHGCM